nr:hypothetical protein RVX_2558 [Nitratidesulfovibrio sp. HK-II]
MGAGKKGPPRPGCACPSRRAHLPHVSRWRHIRFTSGTPMHRSGNLTPLAVHPWNTGRAGVTPCATITRSS